MTRIWPLRHLDLKLISVALAILLWLVIAGDPVVERGLRVPIEMRRFPTHLELGHEIPATVDVRVKGSAGQLRRLAAGDVVVVLDLHDATVGEQVIHLTPAEVSAPLGIDVTQLIPDTLVMTFVARGGSQ